MAIEPNSMTTAVLAPSKPPIDWSNSIKESAIAALVMLLIAIPIFAIKTDQAMNNVLSLETRWGLVATLCGLVFASRLFAHVVLWNRAPGAKPVQLIPDSVTAALGKISPVFGPLALGFAIIFPFVVYIEQGNGALKWVNNYGIQILIYVMLGWGLNIVVGLAGLLDLGYVAFYAIGAYTYALLSTSEPIQLWMAAHIGEGFWQAWAFWFCLPVAGVLAAFWGIILGFPVLRLRGDYLAIVTLAFGEIIYLVALNWVDFTGGGAGITSIPRVTFFGIPFTPGDDGFAARFGIDPSPVLRSIFLYFLILGLCLLTAFVTVRLRRLPVGRAWEALREDEIACRSLGINTTNTKLTAFAIGAMFGGFAGAFFSVRQGFVSPDSFKFLESATILAIVVLGGMGSLVGVVLASIAIVGGTELLRELDFLKQVFGDDFDPTQYRMLLVGLAMVLMMLWKPRGLISTREPSVFLKERKAVSGSLVKEGHG
ncbi:MAG: high-affinity branched-chain amino acid ABC transporter permease LivM [Hyphomicrobiaceae bacterium]|nr:high-affinity branched-chain amino acid ABC transporter permease LivM [Hyphomicrobiaceae bacterium]